MANKVLCVYKQIILCFVTYQVSKFNNVVHITINLMLVHHITKKMFLVECSIT